MKRGKGRVAQKMDSYGLPLVYQIRKATETDIRQIARVHYETGSSTYKFIINPSDMGYRSYDYILSLRKKVFGQEETQSLVLLEKNKIIGFCDIGKLKFHENQILTDAQKEKRKERGEVLALYILKSYQNYGLGKTLFRAARSQLKEMGLTPFLIWALKDNHKARLFYEKQGGQLVEEIDVKIGENHYREVAYHFES